MMFRVLQFIFSRKEEQSTTTFLRSILFVSNTYLLQYLFAFAILVVVNNEWE